MTTRQSKKISLRTTVLWLVVLCLLAFFAGKWSRPPTIQPSSAHPGKSGETETQHTALIDKPILDLIRTSPKDALILANREGKTIDHATMLAIASNWLAKDPDAPLRFLMEDLSLSDSNREQLFTALLPTIVREAPEQGLELAEALSQPRRHIQDLAEAWILIDPENALHHVWNLSPGKFRDNLAIHTYRSWLAKNSEQALNWLLAAENQSMRRHLLSNIKRHRANTNDFTIDTKNYIRLFRESGLQDEFAWTVAERLGREHVVELIELFNTVPWSGHLRSAYSRIKIKDGETFEEALDALDPGRKYRVRHPLIWSWLDENQEDGWRWIQEQGGSDDYSELLATYARKFPHDPKLIPVLSEIDKPQSVATVILEQFLLASDPIQMARESFSPELRHYALLHYFSDIVRFRPHLAAEVLHELPESEIKDQLFIRHVDSMMLQAPERTLELIRQQSPSKVRREQSQKALEAWIWTDPVAARAYIGKADWLDEKLNAQLHLRLAQQLTSSDRSGAIRLLENLPQTDDQYHPLGELLEDFAIRGEAELVRNTIDRLPRGAVREQATLKVLDEFAYQDPRAAYDWIKYEQDKAFQSQAFSTLSRIWVRSDSQAAGQWLRTLPPGKGRDQAVRTMVSHESAQEAHKSAFDWALTIQDESLRKSELQRVYNKWTQGDPFAAQRSINYSSQLSEHEKEQLLQQIR